MKFSVSPLGDWSMKKRVAGGVVLVAIGIGIWLSNLFNGIGPGGAGTDVGMNPDLAVSLDSSDSTGGASETPTDDTAAAGIAGLPVVLIDGQEYFLEQRTGATTKYVPATLDEIVKLVKSTEPDEDGLRVQIKRRGSSRHSAESALDAALHEAGVSEEQIQRHTGFVD